MRMLFLTAAFLNPICVSARCHIPAGRLTVPRAGFESGSITIGCVDDDLEIISLQTGSTYSWVSMGRVGFPKGDDKQVLRVESKIPLNNNEWAAISSDGRLIRKSWIASILGKFAKVEDGVVTAVATLDRTSKFPPGQKWILIPRNQIGGEKVVPGYRYKGGRFFSPTGMSDGSSETR